MKITEKNNFDQTEGVGKSKATRKSNAGVPASNSQSVVSQQGEVGSAKVNLSERAQNIKKIRDQIASAPDVDEAKVAKFKSMLAKGEYKVDSKAVADRMVEEHLKNEIQGE